MTSAQSILLIAVAIVLLGVISSDLIGHGRPPRRRPPGAAGRRERDRAAAELQLVHRAVQSPDGVGAACGAEGSWFAVWAPRGSPHVTCVLCRRIDALDQHPDPLARPETDPP